MEYVDQASRSSEVIQSQPDASASGISADQWLVTPLMNRAIDALSLRAETAGLAVTAVLLALLTLRETWMARMQLALSHPRDLYVAVVEILLIGYLVAARMAAPRAAAGVLAAVEHALDLPAAQREKVRERIGRYRRARFLAAGTVGAVLATLTPLLLRDTTLQPWRYAVWSPEFALRRCLTPAVGWLFGTYVQMTIAEARRTSDLARHLNSIDLFECDTLAPFTRFGLRTTLSAIGLLSVVALLLTEHGFGSVVAVLAGVAALSATAGILLPLRGWRDRIADEKARELACCREALRRARDALVEGRSIPTGHGRLADIVAYRQLVESVSEWPVDSETILRAGAYVLLPIAFWLSGTIAPDTLLSLAEILAG